MGTNILGYFIVFQVPPDKLQDHFISTKTPDVDLIPSEGNDFCLQHIS